jgi:hypothetical protein
MIIASLFIPPYWHVDKSVWEAAGLFFIMAGLFKFFENVENGKPAKFSTGWTIEFFPHKNKHTHKIYVASSWRNTYYPDVVKALREAGHDVYDFRNPPSGDPGFHWTDVDEHCADWTPKQYQDNLTHPLAERQFKNDIDAMSACDACVLVLPCGRSAHTEAGWFAGQGKKVFAYIPDKDSFEPELMYKLFIKVCVSLEELIETIR